MTNIIWGCFWMINIRKLEENEKLPINLLILADPSEEMILDYTSRGLCHIAEVNGEIIGAYVLIKTRPKTMEIVNIAVDESYQGRGIGKSLILHAIEQAKESGAKTLEIGTGNSSIGQLALYQKCGFRISVIDKDFFVRHYNEKIIENGINCVDMIRLSKDFD